MSIQQRIYLLLIAASLPLIALVLFGATGGDDANITWWSAYSLSHFGQLEEYGGERVEQSSSLLHVLLLAGLHSTTGIPMPALGTGLSLFMGFATVLAASSLAKHWGAGDKGTLLAAALTATCHPLTYWSTSGLDTSLSAFSFVLLVLNTSKYFQGKGNLLPVCLAIALFLTARPEGFFVFAAMLGFAGTISILKREDKNKAEGRRLAILALVALLMFAILCIFRWTYFGRLFPEPVYTKAAGVNWYKVKQGIKYFLRYAIHPVMMSWLILTTVGIWRLWKTSPASRKVSMWVLGASISVTVFIVLTGGDWMENARYLAPLLSCLMAFVAITVSGETTWKKIARPLLLVSQVATLLVTAALFSRGRPLWTMHKIQLPENAKNEFSWFQYACKDGERDIPTALKLDEVYQAVHAAKGDTVTFMSGQAGMIPYHLASKHPHEFRWVDLWGLSDRSVAECPPTREVQLIPIPSWNWEKYFELLPRIRKECPTFPEPDIISEIDDSGFMPSLLEQNGYTVVYQQSGLLPSGDPLFPGLVYNAGQVIAVKRELALLANLEKAGHFTFPEK